MNIFTLIHLLGRLRRAKLAGVGSLLPSRVSQQGSQQPPNTHLRILEDFYKEFFLYNCYIIVFMHVCLSIGVSVCS